MFVDELLKELKRQIAIVGIYFRSSDDYKRGVEFTVALLEKIVATAAEKEARHA